MDMTTSCETTPKPIVRLAEEVVNRIAAGEVIHRPSSALKELIENSIDAGSTAINITVKDGGNKLLQVQDNGHGVREADLPILCVRHTTSKLEAYEDLRSIATLGFRGEALASISYVAHLSVTTMTRDHPHALKCNYSNGELLGSPTPCAGVPGTIICAEDLFYNVIQRKKALKGASEEYARILDVVGRYALLYTHAAFSCKKHGETRVDVHTQGKSDRLDAIRAVFGSHVARHLIPLSTSMGPPLDAGQRQSTGSASAADGADGNGGASGTGDPEASGAGAGPRFSVEGLVSNAEYTSRKATLVLFINRRLVECPPLKRACEAVYSTLLPKADKPWLFLNIDMLPQQVDVNCHPTKKEVQFMHTEAVVQHVQGALEAALRGCDSVRTFLKQTLLVDSMPAAEGPAAEEAVPGGGSKRGGSAAKQPYRPNKLVRTDHSNQAGALHAYLNVPPGARPSQVRGGAGRGGGASEGGGGGGEAESGDWAARPGSQEPSQAGAGALEATPAEGGAVLSLLVRRRKRAKAVSELTSIQELVAATEAAAHSQLTAIFREHAYIGMADDRLACIQYKTRLYIVHVPNITRELVYQQVLRRFENFGRVRLSQPARVRELVEVALEEEEAEGRWSSAAGPKNQIAAAAEALLLEKAPMLQEYFALDIDADGRLRTLPLVLDQYTPDLDFLPQFVLALSNEVDWETEKECFDSIAGVIADFYALKPTPPEDAAPEPAYLPPLVLSDFCQPCTPAPEAADAGGAQQPGGGSQVQRLKQGAHTSAQEWTIQHVLFPTLRLFLSPPARFATDGTVLQVACLEQLYRIFERC